MLKFSLILILSVCCMTAFSQPAPIPGKFVHSVYFWLKNPDSESDKKEFLASLEKFIQSSKYITSYHIAPPAGTPREVVDNSYTFNLVATFESAELQDLYQKEDVHLTFIEEASHLWERVQIYDSYPGRDLKPDFVRSDIQVGVVVSDLEKSVNFYTNVLGMVKTGEFSIDEDFGKRSGLSNGEPFDVVVLGTSDNPSASQWKVMSFKNPARQAKNNHIQDHLGMRYITLFVNNLDTLLNRLEAAGIELLGESPTSLPDGRRFVLIQDPDGIFIELIGN
ncbi:VOC family protein [Fulvivirga sedimenti]|uniref:VOC family protein n=1 Tax=Fulvivirga sedimenti TaxID=2879465 RepID=A0A9X1HRH8_9BACT|nr:VOC family protein [Fulvivirga sedimenti]MCA6074688.1 VOC family protein [Fulvivirga sedimenti]MCA6075865.1 VOC family protein [Fulvivirga sedimenti]MCA6076993.1 VOC family protein [Fulvivirga sedimenti]